MASNIVVSSRPFTLLSLAVFLVLAGAFSSYAAWEDYKPYTLAEAIERYAKFGNERSDTPIKERYDLFPRVPLRVQVVFTGRMRDLPDGRRQTIQRWARSFLKETNRAVVQSIEKEIEVREAGKSYWLPIQNVLIPSLRDEVGNGGRAALYVLLVGARNKDFVFIVNEFDAL